MKVNPKVVTSIGLCLILTGGFSCKNKPIPIHHMPLLIYKAYFENEVNDFARLNLSFDKAIMVNDFTGTSLVDINPSFINQLAKDHDGWNEEIVKAVRHLSRNSKSVPEQNDLASELAELVRVVSQSYIDDIFQPEPVLGWDKFYENHPNSSGVYYLSGVGFSDNYAAILAEHNSNNLAGSASIVIFMYLEGSWSVFDTLELWVS